MPAGGTFGLPPALVAVVDDRVGVIGPVRRFVEALTTALAAAGRVVDAPKSPEFLALTIFFPLGGSS